MKTLYVPGSLGKIRTFLSKVFKRRSFIRQIIPLPHSWRYKLTEIWLHSSQPQQKCFTMKMISYSSGCVWQLGLLWCDGFTTLFNCNQTAWGSKLLSFPTCSFLHPCSLSTLTKHVSVEHLCSEAHRRGISCSFCWYSSAAIADIFLSQEILQSWAAECSLECCSTSSLSQPSFLRQTFFAGSLFSTWDDQVAMTVLPGGLQWTSEQPHKPLYHCPRRKCVQALECGSSCRREGRLCEGTGSYICSILKSGDAFRAVCLIS